MNTYDLTLRFGEFIRKRREELGMTQDSFDGMSRSYINSIENGGQRPKQEKTIIQLHRELRIDQLEKSVKWLWAYSLFDENPDWSFGQYQHIRDPFIVQLVRKLEDAPPEMRQKFVKMAELLEGGA